MESGDGRWLDTVENPALTRTRNVKVVNETHFASHLVGLENEFDCRLEGDLWYHSADAEVGGVRIEIHELWRRLAP
jgi:hypothetical protein